MTEESKKERRTKPYKASELFDIICKRIELPDILDHHLANKYNDKEITNVDWRFENRLEYGGNEGIYLHVDAGDIYLGTFKTLDTSDEAMRRMALLLADFIIAGSKFVNSHIDDFTWEGYIVATANDFKWWWFCGTLDRAVRRVKEDGSLRILDARTRMDITDRKDIAKMLKEDTRND